MWEPVALPFTNTAIPILPTTDEIRACENVLWERLNRKVVAINEEIIVKFGGSNTVWEGQALIYLERHVPQVPAPRLFAMFQDSKQVSLVMQRAPGEQLEKVWPTLMESEKESITATLRQVFDSMRVAKCPWPNFFGGLDGGSLRHYLFYSQDGSHKHMGPFDSEATFVAGLTDNFRFLCTRNSRPDLKCRFWEAHLGSVLQGHRPTLTHGDLHKKNIVVNENKSLSREGEERSFDVVIVDWEHAGWYPEFWEFFTASAMFAMTYWEDDWCLHATQFLPVYPGELAIMRMFDKDMGY